MDAITYHNPACGTSRNTLALILAAGLTVREAIRENGTADAQRGLDHPALTDGQLIATPTSSIALSS